MDAAPHTVTVVGNYRSVVEDEIAFGRDARVFDVRISLTAKAQAKPSPEEKIEQWVRQHPLPESGAVEKIPTHHFSSH